MRTVTVRKKRSWRWGIRFLTGFFALVMTVVCRLYAKMDLAFSMLLCCPVLVPMAVLLWYNERWHITFGPEGISWKGMIRPWTQVDRVWESWSYSEDQVIAIRFRDGKTLRFRIEEENAGKAKAMICSHCSIMQGPK